MLRHSAYVNLATNICKVVIFGTISVIAAAILLLLVGLEQNNETRTAICLLICGIAFMYIASSYLLLQRSYYHLVGSMLVLFYTLFATGMALTWGINTPLVPLFFAFAIVLAGILLTARYALYAALLSGALLICVQAVGNAGWHQPDISWVHDSTSYDDVFAYFPVLAMLALVSWLCSREMKRTLVQAKHAEEALLRQKATLKNQVKQRTMELRKAQLEEMQHMYRFAELGHLGATLLHDLANNVTALTLEVDSMHNTETVMRVQQIIHCLEGVVDNARSRLHGTAQERTFNIVRNVREVITFLQPKAVKAGATIELQRPGRAWKYTGDPDSLSQVVAIIASNAIDAYSTKTSLSKKDRRVVVSMQKTQAYSIIRVSDWGYGIAKSDRKLLFKPCHSAKKTGLGLGLYIAKQIIEMQFQGSIEISPDGDHTEFIIKLPQKDERA